MPDLALLDGGGALLVFGLVHDTGGDCAVGGTLMSARIRCETTRSAGTILAGAGIAGVGAYLLLRGERTRVGPEVVAGAGRLPLRQRVSW